MILAARAAHHSPGFERCWLRPAKPAWAQCSRSRRPDWHLMAVINTLIEFWGLVEPHRGRRIMILAISMIDCYSE